MRGLRSRPPGAADLPSRRPTFTAALEQCEQLFVAAAAVGYAARPLPLFYALSQAGRAIAAALDFSDKSWRLKGHGVRSHRFDAERLWDVEVQNHGSDSYTRVAELLDSPSLPNSARLGDLWATLPEFSRRLPPDAYRARALRVEREIMKGPETFGGPDVYSTSIGISPAWLYGIDPRIECTAEPKVAVTEYLSHYPTLAGFEGDLGEDRPARFRSVAGELGVRLVWQADGPLESHRAERIDRMCVRTGDGEQWVAPSVAGNVRPVDPLVAWWAILHALSMLARYEPATWQQHLDIDVSTDAVVIEELLDGALIDVPFLLIQALAE